MKIKKQTAIQELKELLEAGITIEKLKAKIPRLQATEQINITDAYRAGKGKESFDRTCEDIVYYQRTYINPNYGECSFEY